ncbi:MAG: N-acetylmuramoyl-L-alanine amidase [Saprospiraceae bacterium]|nr:N-acetylmuramoyl-L-alanine amidase [Saprospiraceae bacterium]
MLQQIIQAIRALFQSIFDSAPSPRINAEPPLEKPQDASELDPIPNDTLLVIERLEEVIDQAAALKPVETLDSSPEVPVTKPSGRYAWCLDNGHGKLTAGKRSPLFDDGVTRFFEYAFNRDIVQRIARSLTQHGIEHLVVVPEEEIGDFLEGRVARANDWASQLPKCFVSVHANAGPVPDDTRDWSMASGAETWYYHTSVSGRKLAAVFQKHICEKTGFRNRGIKSQATKQFFVLQKTLMPAILTENGFYNNKTEVLFLMSEEGRQKIADAHVAAILEIEQNGL